MLNAYLRAMATLEQCGDAREESYDPAIKDLLETLAAENSEQLHRYRTTLPSLILTDFCSVAKRGGDVE